MKSIYVDCPFCGDQDFDLIGLKSHLFEWCEVFPSVESIEEERLRLKLDKESEIISEEERKREMKQ